MTTRSKFFFILLLLILAVPASVLAAEAENAAEAMAALPENIIMGGTAEPPRLVRAKGWEWDHEVRVWLPGTYQSSGKTYPTLWVTDNNLETMRAAVFGSEMGRAPEVIIVAVGAPAGTSIAEFQRRRTWDFIPDKSLMGPMFAEVPEEMIGGAPGFLDFLVNQLRPMLAKEYRMDPNDHAYAGHSGGGQFGLYTLFTKPESFSRYLISSPATYQPWLDMEAAWFEQHKDLKAKVFMSAGEAEAGDPRMAQAQIASTVVLMAERLLSRKYPSLDLTVRIFPGEDHLTVIPIAYTHGVHWLWPKP